jgi:hypothetical protein
MEPSLDIAVFPSRVTLNAHGLQRSRKVQQTGVRLIVQRQKLELSRFIKAQSNGFAIRVMRSSILSRQIQNVLLPPFLPPAHILTLVNVNKIPMAGQRVETIIEYCMEYHGFPRLQSDEQVVFGGA